MERHHIKWLPVIENDKMVGIITRANLLHAMASFVDEGGYGNTRALARRTGNAARRSTLRCGSEDGEYRYRVKSADEPFDRVVKENELERVL